MLFSGGTSEYQLDDGRLDMECRLRLSCNVRTTAQRCADWFVLRQFRVTGTIAGYTLLSHPTTLSLSGYGSAVTPPSTPTQCLQMFTASWFSTTWATEHMKRRTANEAAALSALSSRAFVRAVFEYGMLYRNDYPWIACSPDGVAWIDLTALCVESGCTHTAASVEIKTSIAASSLDPAMHNASIDVVSCVVRDDNFKKLIPQQHCGQILQHALLLAVD